MRETRTVLQQVRLTPSEQRLLEGIKAKYGMVNTSEALRMAIYQTTALLSGRGEGKPNEATR